MSSKDKDGNENANETMNQNNNIIKGLNDSFD